MSTVIELQNISKRFNDTLAVNNVSLLIDEGEIISLLGPSGCGKTTTLRMIAGFEIPTEGRILLRGENIVNKPPRERNMGMVFQNYALFPHMSIFDNIAFGLRMRKQKEAVIKEKVKIYLDLVKLNGFENRYPHQLSGGQQQRVALARALITEPNVLLMDEPFGALDRKLRETMQLEIRNILKRLKITAVFVTHDQDEALVLSDRIVVMNQGVIEQIDSPKQIYEWPGTKFVANFIGTSNVFEGEVKEREDGKFKVITQSGMILTLEGENKGEKAIVTIRPEKVYIAPQQEITQPNTFEGVVENIKYLGTITQYYVSINDDCTVIVNCQNCSFQDGFYELGQKVNVSFDSCCINVVDR